MKVQSLATQLTNSAIALRNGANLMLDAAARIEDLEDHVSRLESDVADAQAAARFAIERAETMLRAGMHPVDRAIDTAAGNAPRG